MDLGVHCAHLTWPVGPAAAGTTLADVARAAGQGGVRTLTHGDCDLSADTTSGVEDAAIAVMTLIDAPPTEQAFDRLRARRNASR